MHSDAGSAGSVDATRPPEDGSVYMSLSSVRLLILSFLLFNWQHGCKYGQEGGGRYCKVAALGKSRYILRASKPILADNGHLQIDIAHHSPRNILRHNACCT